MAMNRFGWRVSHPYLFHFNTEKKYMLFGDGYYCDWLKYVLYWRKPAKMTHGFSAIATINQSINRDVLNADTISHRWFQVTRKKTSPASTLQTVLFGFHFTMGNCRPHTTSNCIVYARTSSNRCYAISNTSTATHRLDLIAKKTGVR